MGPNETFDPDSIKTKLTLVVGQMTFNTITMAPVPLLWANKHAHTAWLGLCFGAAVYQGANFFFEIFSRRYMAQFAGMEDTVEVYDSDAMEVVEEKEEKKE